MIGAPTGRYGEGVMAWVRLKPQAAATADERTAFWRAGPATFKVPRYWKFVDGFPLTETGKVRKHAVREAAVAELGLAPLSDAGPGVLSVQSFVPFPPSDRLVAASAPVSS